MKTTNRYIVSLLLVSGVAGFGIHGKSQWAYFDVRDGVSTNPPACADASCLGEGMRQFKDAAIDAGAIELTIALPPSRELLIPVDPKEATNSLTLQERADAGDSKAQTRLADGLLGNRAAGRFEKDPVEAYKWAYIASSKGNKEAEDLLKECDLFLSAEDRAKGKALAEEYLAEQRKEPEKSDALRENDEGQ